MNTNEKNTKNQVESENCIKKSRADYRREKKAAVKAKESKSKNEKVQGSTLALCDQELLRKRNKRGQAPLRNYYKYITIIY